MTLWMQDRLAWVRGQNGSDAEVRNTHDAMIAQLSARDIAGNRLRAEGVEDRYVFAPGTIMQALETDGGAGDLERPVAERLWIRVYYPSRERALLDDANLPIRAITVGVNVSHDGYVLKAGVLGNLNVDRDSISYDWD